MENFQYRLDRTAFQMLSFEEADAAMQSPHALAEEERFRYFNYLMSIAYRFLGEPWPVMDKTVFEMRKRS
ncbi:MAG: hypothetical protein SFU87_06135 [Chitinophagaceae bacterium]|nr:hypothetical protein [Chitinophagaceae bacterium]